MLEDIHEFCSERLEPPPEIARLIRLADIRSSRRSRQGRLPPPEAIESSLIIFCIWKTLLQSNATPYLLFHKLQRDFRIPRP